jgi:hypothetical protein
MGITKTESMETKEVRKKINKIVSEIDDNNFLVNLYDLLQNKANEQSDIEVMGELTPKQMAQLKISMKQLDEGKGTPHEIVIARLKKLSR